MEIGKRPEHRREYWELLKEQTEAKLAQVALVLSRFDYLESGQIPIDFREEGQEL